MEYFLVFFYLLILVYFYDLKGYKKFKKIHRITLLWVLILLAGLRYRVGPDTISYELYFKDFIVPLSDLDLDSFIFTRYQPFWILLNSFCKSFGSFVWVQMIAAFIFNSCVFYFFKKSTSKFFTAVLIYFLLEYLYLSMDVMREAIAIGLFLIAILKLSNKKYLTYYLIIIIATLFHFFAGFAFLIPIILTKKIHSNVKISFAVISLIFILSLGSATESIGTFVNIFTESKDLSFFAEFEELSLTPLGYFFNFMRIIPLFLITLFYKKNKELSFVFLPKRYILIFSYLFIYIVIIRIFAVPFAERLLNYFIIFVQLLLLNFSYDFAKRYFKNNSRFIGVLLPIFIHFFFYISTFLKISPYYGVRYYKIYYPYYSVFSEGIDKDREKIIYLAGKY